MESCTSNKQVLKMEVAVLKRLQNSSPHICEFIGCGRNNKVNYVVMALLGPNLSELRKHQPNQSFSISTTLRVGIQVIAAVQAMHDCGFLHRDIKPSNFAIGDTPETSRTCFMLDYGLARQYTTVTGEVRQPRPVAGFRGTVRYASLNAHLSRDLGRHDDLWSVFYLMVELAMGHLPWRRIRDKEEAGEFKAKYDHKKLIRALPHEFLVFLEHLKSSSYFDKPDYQLVTGCIEDAITRLGVQEADPYDWEQDFSAPSMTTASIVSQPAVKLVNEERGELDAHSPMKTLQTSKTNCSGVGDLSDNGGDSEPRNEQHFNLTVPPRSFMKKLPYKTRHPADDKNLNGNPIESGPDNSRSNPANPNQILHGEGVSIEHVPTRDLNIVNRYVSEDEEEGEGEVYGDAMSPSWHKHSPASNSNQEEMEEVGNRNGQYHMHVGSTCEGVAPVKSYQTESLNRFYEIGSNAARESVVSYKSFSRKTADKEQQPHRESHVSSQYFSKTSDTSQSSRRTDILNNAVVYPKGHGGDFMSGFDPQKKDNPPPLPAIQVQEPRQSHSSREDDKLKTGSCERGGSTDSQESEECDQSSEKLAKVLMYHQLLMKSSSSQSESTKSIELLFAQKTLHMDFANQLMSRAKKGEGSKESRKKNREGIQANRTSPQLHISEVMRDSVDTEAVDSNQSHSPLQLSASEHTGNAVQVGTEHIKPVPKLSDGRKTRSASTFLEVLPQPVMIHPRPPPNPPPLNYSVSLMARRRRFVRSKATKSKKS